MPSSDKPWPATTGPTAPQLAAYAAEQRNGAETVLEEWKVVDKWWTEKPIRTEYRYIQRPGVGKVTQKRVEGGEWEDHERLGYQPSEEQS